MMVIGLMSGTSADGIDAALVEISAGDATARDWRLLKHITTPHTQAMRDEILTCARANTSTVDRVCALNAALGEAFAAAVIDVAHQAGVPLGQIDLIGSHGQTAWHIPGQATLQLGEPAVIAERTGATVVSHFRARDIAAGGQGAPLVAYVDALLLTHPNKTRAAQNIGGIANVTFLPSGEIGGGSISSLQSPMAFDTGPGNMLMDDAVRRMTHGAQQCDLDGAIAVRGQIDGALLEELLDHPFLQAQPPKTTGRETFGAQFGEAIWAQAAERGLQPEDVVATLTMFTAASIAQAYRQFLPAQPEEVIVSGGGARNPALMRMLQAQLGPSACVIPSDAVGLPCDAKEAIAFALLACETVHNRPGNLPAATGARRAVVLGSITPGTRMRAIEIS
jgi:anhydro-N-acetylmuramic acid kinase